MVAFVTIGVEFYMRRLLEGRQCGFPFLPSSNMMGRLTDLGSLNSIPILCCVVAARLPIMMIIAVASDYGSSYTSIVLLRLPSKIQVQSFVQKECNNKGNNRGFPIGISAHTTSPAAAYYFSL
jgi:hypothetical protein